MTPKSTRRTFLKTGAAAGAAAVAGCAGEIPDDRVTVTEVDSAPRSLDAPKEPTVDRVAADPTAIPDPVDREESATVEAELTTREVTAEIEDGVTFEYMTFDGQIPGPMIRARVGDTVDLTVHNAEDNRMPHNVDLHAVRGPGGGAEATNVAPGETERVRFKVTYPGAFIYHCAVANMDYHISSGMFGIILVEPEGGLPEVDREFYLGQHEVYTDGETGQEGHHTFDMGAMAREEPTYVLVNGEKYAVTPDNYGAMAAETGETARVYYCVGGPNLASSFHPIGSVWDEVYPQGGLGGRPQRNIQTTPVQPGSTAIATMHYPVPGPIKLVDHALSRVARKGAMAVVGVEGEENPEIFDPNPDG
ncbi:copper-containing nitrite reductase [Halosimplex pelagicum]|uniref:Copper-containing nitrite reductase n=1 Tax=Halosimplex pelagicum TaxID=869886 RepID=A0A7D5T237_9EURY|nr:copper-containing nitrite reductase [Halosimplex pelagicum]QLH80871.1 nitrite reductase, copper-containing [Halosimplex pelagicum]